MADQAGYGDSGVDGEARPGPSSEKSRGRGKSGGPRANADDPIESALAYGGVVDLSALDLDKPSGETADWAGLLAQLVVEIGFLFKVCYKLTVRGQETKTDSKFQRRRFTDKVGGSDNNKVEVGLYISFPTGDSSTGAGEFTPGRFKSLVAPYLYSEFRSRTIIPPLLAVIGFKELDAGWTALSDKLLETFPIITSDQKDAPWLLRQEKLCGAAARKMYGHFKPDETVNGTAWDVAVELADIFFRGHGFNFAAPLTPRSGFMERAALWLFVCSPDRCPPAYIGFAGIAEFGAMLALFTDARNLVMASLLTGTSAQKAQQTSEFYRSYVRRTE